MKNLNQIYSDMIDDKVIKPEVINKAQYDQYIDDSDIVVLKKFYHYVDSKGKKQAQYTYLKIDKREIDSVLFNQYMQVKSYAKITEMNRLTQLIHIISIFTIVILFLILLGSCS